MAETYHNTALGSAFKPCCAAWGTIPSYGVMHSDDCPELRRIVLARAPLTMAEEIARAVPYVLIEDVELLRQDLFRYMQIASDEAESCGAATAAADTLVDLLDVYLSVDGTRGVYDATLCLKMRRALTMMVDQMKSQAKNRA